MKSNFNKLEMKLTENIWFSVFAEHESASSPYKFLTKGGLSYPGRNLTAGIDIYQPPEGYGREYAGSIYVQWAEGGRAEAQFHIAQRNNAFPDYVISSTINVSGFKEIKIKGNLAKEDDKASANIDWNFGLEKYSAVVEYFPGQNVLANKKLTGKLDMDKVQYQGNVELKNTETEKSVAIDLVAEQHIYLLLQTKNSFNDIKFDFSWDKDRDADKRILLETSLHQDNLLAHMKLYQYEGKINGSYTRDSANATLQWGEKKMDIQTKCVLSWQHLEVLLGLQTSNPLFKNIKSYLLVMATPLQDGSGILQSKVRKCP